MKLIKFHSIEKINYTKYKEMDVDNDINGHVYHERIKTGIPEITRTEYKQYYIPINKIECLWSFDKKYMVNNVQVNKEEFEKVLKQMEE